MAGDVATAGAAETDVTQVPEADDRVAPDTAMPGTPDGQPDGKLTLPVGGAREHEVSDIDARREQRQTGEDQKRGQRLGEAPAQDVLALSGRSELDVIEVLRARTRWGLSVRHEGLKDGVRFGAGALNGDAGF